MFRCFLSSSAFLASFHHGSFVYLCFFVSEFLLLSSVSLLLMEQMNRMNSRVDEIQDFVKTNIPTLTDNKNGKQVSFSD